MLGLSEVNTAVESKVDEIIEAIFSMAQERADRYPDQRDTTLDFAIADISVEHNMRAVQEANIEGCPDDNALREYLTIRLEEVKSRIEGLKTGVGAAPVIEQPETALIVGTTANENKGFERMINAAVALADKGVQVTICLMDKEAQPIDISGSTMPEVFPKLMAASTDSDFQAMLPRKMEVIMKAVMHPNITRAAGF